VTAPSIVTRAAPVNTLHRRLPAILDLHVPVVRQLGVSAPFLLDSGHSPRPTLKHSSAQDDVPLR
jgi:hypothetical protein